MGTSSHLHPIARILRLLLGCGVELWGLLGWARSYDVGEEPYVRQGYQFEPHIFRSLILTFQEGVVCIGLIAFRVGMISMFGVGSCAYYP